LDTSLQLLRPTALLPPLLTSLLRPPLLTPLLLLLLLLQDCVSSIAKKLAAVTANSSSSSSMASARLRGKRKVGDLLLLPHCPRVNCDTANVHLGPKGFHRYDSSTK
jgi:hypothetical protein